jgi:PAS domain S-box-containing protein
MKADDILPLLTWRARPDMSCEYVNPAWLEYTGYTLEQALGEGWTRCLHPEDLAAWLDTCVRAFDERKPFDIEYRLRRHDGEYRWIRERAAPRFSREGAFLGYAGGGIDIDEHKRNELGLARELERERRMRSAQGRVISSLLERMPHGPLLHGVRVLVVDHDPAALDGVVKPLATAGADVRAAGSIPEALETFGAWRPDVLLCESNGTLRAAALTPDPARVAGGYDAQLEKPVEPVALVATVARLAA